MEPPPSGSPQPYQSFLVGLLDHPAASWAWPLAGLVLFSLIVLAGAYHTAFFSLSGREINTVHDEDAEDYDHYRLLRRFMERPKLLYATLHLVELLGQLGLFLISLAAGYKLAVVMGWHIGLTLLGVAMLVVFPLLFFVGLPLRLWAAQHKLSLLTGMAGLVQVLTVVLWPLAWFYRIGLKLLQSSAPQSVLATGTERLHEAIQQQNEEDSPEEEKAILRALVNLNAIPVRSILRSRMEVKALDLELTTAEVIQMVNEFGYSRLPVYQDSLDQIKGILYVKDLLPLLGKTAEIKWQDHLRPAYYVPQSKRIHRLLKEFQDKHLHIAIVTDEYGGTAGIVTLQDILEEIFGDIRDEFDRDKVDYKQLPDGSYLFEGKTNLLDFAKALELTEEQTDTLRGDGEHESLGGLILQQAGTIPEQGYTMEMAHMHFRVEAVTPNSIRQVRVQLEKAAD